MRETTGRFTMPRGVPVEAPVRTPSTLLLSGATAAAFITDAFLISFAGTETATRETDSELAMARVGTAVTAPATFWFT